MKAVQHFTPDYLRQCRQMPEDFRRLHGGAAATKPGKSRLISLKVPEDLLAAFRDKARLEGRAYQTQIKELMRQWVLGG